MKKAIILLCTGGLVLFCAVKCYQFDKERWGGWPFPKAGSIESMYSGEETNYEFLQVYADRTFPVDEAGVVEGDFKLSYFTDFDALETFIFIPQLWSIHPKFREDRDCLYELSLQIEYSWIGRDGLVKKAFVKNYNSPDDTISRGGDTRFDYVPLPRNKTIHYVITHGPIIYKDFDLGHPHDSVLAPELNEATFLVVEKRRHGSGSLNRKIARD